MIYIYHFIIYLSIYISISIYIYICLYIYIIIYDICKTNIWKQHTHSPTLLLKYTTVLHTDRTSFQVKVLRGWERRSHVGGEGVRTAWWETQGIFRGENRPPPPQVVMEAVLHHRPVVGLRRPDVGGGAQLAPGPLVVAAVAVGLLAERVGPGVGPEERRHRHTHTHTRSIRGSIAPIGGFSDSLGDVVLTGAQEQKLSWWIHPIISEHLLFSLRRDDDFNIYIYIYIQYILYIYIHT